MESDERSFQYPVIDEKKCIECGKCKDVCYFYKDLPSNINIGGAKVYAAKHLSDEIRRVSSSGGAFTALSDLTIKNHGVVYGAKYNEEFVVVHGRAETSIERNKFRGSKYVQSKLDGVFKEVKEDLQNGMVVLFTGTPCQTAGLREFLAESNVDTSRLVLCDLICHSAPSPLMLKEHIAYLERKNSSKLIRYEHRYKSNKVPWGQHTECASFNNGVIDFKTQISQNHKHLFCSDYISRPSCEECVFSSPYLKVSDITIGDFWGIDKLAPDFVDSKGVSLIIVNTKKGKELFDSIREDMMLREISLEEAYKNNHSKPIKRNPKTENFWKDYLDYGYGYVLKKYCNNTYLGKMKFILKNKLRSILFKLGLLEKIKKILR